MTLPRPMMTVRMLLKSWATPPARVPMASIFCAWRSCSSRLLVGDVLDQGDEVVDRPVVPTHAAHRNRGVDDPAVLADVPLIQGIAVDFPCKSPLVAVDGHGQIIGMGQLSQFRPKLAPLYPSFSTPHRLLRLCRLSGR